MVAPPEGRPEVNPVESIEMFARLLYVPVYAGLESRDVERLAFEAARAF